MTRWMLSLVFVVGAVGLSAQFTEQKTQNWPAPAPKPSGGGTTSGGTTGGGGTTCPSQSVTVGDLTLSIRGNEGAASYPPPPIVGIQTQCENGISALANALLPGVNPIGSGVALLNLEHALNANAQGDSFSKTGNFGSYFTPRFNPYHTYRDDAATVRLVRLPQDDPHGLGYTTIYHMVSPNIVDVSFSVTLGDTGWLQTSYGNYLLLFFANYTAPLSTAVPPGVFMDGANGWQWFTFPFNKSLLGSAYGCAIRQYGSPALTFDPTTTGPWDYCSYPDAASQYVQPSWVQQFPGGMQIQWITDRGDSPTDRILISGMKWFANQNKLPADYAYIVNQPQPGQTYGFRLRMIVEPNSDAIHWTQNLVDAQQTWAGSVWP